MRQSRVPKGLSIKRNWASQFGLIASTHAQCNLLPLGSYLSPHLTLQPWNLEDHAMARVVSFSKSFLLCYSLYELEMQKFAIFFYTGKHRKRKLNPPGMSLVPGFRTAPPDAPLCQIFFFPPTLTLFRLGGGGTIQVSALLCWNGLQ